LPVRYGMLAEVLAIVGLVVGHEKLHVDTCVALYPKPFLFLSHVPGQ
jgi:hypothetical protein